MAERKRGPVKLTKKRVALGVAMLFVLALLGYAIFYVVASNTQNIDLAPEEIIQVDRGDVSAVFVTTATVESGQQGVFEILNGTRVNEVHVRVGDAVREGDLLATFDTGSLDEMLRQKRNDYDNARRSLRQYQQSAQQAPAQSAALQRQITELEASIAQMQAQQPEPEAPATPSTPEGNAQLDDLRRVVSGLMGNTRIANFLVDQVFLAEGGNVDQTLAAFQSMMSGMGGFDLGSMMGGMGDMGQLLNTELMGASLQLMQLRVQESMLNLQAGVSLENVHQALAESAGSAYRQASTTIAQLRQGWRATHDGIVREINITAGEVYRSEDGGNGGGLDMTTMLASIAMGNADIGTMLGGLFSTTVSGMVVEYYPFMARFMLGRYDIARISLDQPARIVSVSGEEFDGVVSFINPVASDSTGLDIGNILGGGGARGVEARVSIPEPDLSLTIGLDVDVYIELESRENVLRIPITAVRFDSELQSHFVFALDRENRTLRQVFVETGLFDQSGTTAWFEITDGLREGEEILRTAASGLQNGDRVRLV